MCWSCSIIKTNLKSDGNDHSKDVEVKLNCGDLLIMNTVVNQHFKHRIPPMNAKEKKKFAHPRYSLTFRIVASDYENASINTEDTDEGEEETDDDEEEGDENVEENASASIDAGTLSPSPL